MSASRWRNQQAVALFRLFHKLLGTGGLATVLLSGLAVSLLELGGLALLFPFLKLVTDPSFHQWILTWAAPTAVLNALQDQRRAVLLVGIGLMAIYVLRGCITAKLVRYQANIAARINCSTSDHLIETALRSRYQLFLTHSPTQIAGISYSNTTHTALLFQSASTALNEAILLAVVVGGLLLASPSGFASLVVVALMLGLFVFRPLSRQVASIGRHTQEVDLARHRFVFAMASAIRDIKIMGLETPFARRNHDLVKKHANLAADYVSIATTQRVAVEVVLVCSVVGAAIWFAWVGGDLSQSAPIIGTMGLVAVRTAPALSRLAAAFNGFRYSLPFVVTLLELRGELGGFSQERHTQDADFPGDYKAEDISFGYGDRQILNGCTIRIGQGEVIALVGPSGSGKSTLLDLLAGLLPPATGHFSLGNKPFSPFTSLHFPARLGYVPQSIALFDGSIAFNIALDPSPDLQRLHRAIERASLTAFVDGLPEGLNTQLGEGGRGLSGGQRQRMGIARALYRDPAFLILDEVTSALDASTARAVMDDLLAMRGSVSMLFVTHQLDQVPADRVYRLDQGVLTLVNPGHGAGA